MGLGPIQLAVFRCPLIAVGLYYLEVLCPSVPVTISKKMGFPVIHLHYVAAIAAISTSTFADTTWLERTRSSQFGTNISETSTLTPYGSIMYQQVQQVQYFARTFAFRPLCFQDFTSMGGGGYA